MSGWDGWDEAGEKVTFEGVRVWNPPKLPAVGDVVDITGYDVVLRVTSVQPDGFKGVLENRE